MFCWEGVSPMVELLKNLTLGQIVQWAVLVMAALSTVLEFSKIKVNPWSAVGRFIGRAINKELSAEIAEAGGKLSGTHPPVWR